MSQEYPKVEPESKIVSPVESQGTPLTLDQKVIAAASKLDLEGLRLSQDFPAEVGVRKLLTAVPVRKPNRQTFVRTHPDPSYRIETAILELRERRESYLVVKALWHELASEIAPKLLITAVDRQGNIFLWPIQLPDSSGRHHPWHVSLLEAAQRAERRWVRVTANMSQGAYDVFEASDNLGEPQWPDESFQDLLGIAFRYRLIECLDHAAVRELRGQL